jgi:tRNA (guanosine-2'-O-)-methyltransferase
LAFGVPLAVLGVVSACGRPPSRASSERKILDHAELEASPGAVLETCTPTGPERCFNAVDDNCNGILDEGCGVNTGLIQIAIAWDESQADVDLNVTDPDGAMVEVGRVGRSGLVKERDCPGRNRECRGQNMENVYLEQGDPVRGRYTVRVELVSLGGAEPPIHVRLGARIGPRTYAVRFELLEPEERRTLRLRL